MAQAVGQEVEDVDDADPHTPDAGIEPPHDPQYTSTAGAPSIAASAPKALADLPARAPKSTG